MKKIILIILALCIGFFALISSMVIAISLTLVAFVFSKTQKKSVRDSTIIEGEYSHVIEGECTNVTHSKI